MGGDGRVEGGRRDGGKGEGEGGVPQGGHYPHLPISLSTGAGIFSMSRDAPHWLRVSVTSLSNGREMVASLGQNNREVHGRSHSLWFLRWA